MKLITGAEAIGKEITNIATTGKRFEKRLHVAAASCVDHFRVHGDNTLINRLIGVLPGAVRGNAIRSWCVAFGGMSYDKKTKELVKDNKSKVNMKKILEVSPFEFKPEPEYKDWDMEEAFVKFMTTAARRIKDNEKREDAHNKVNMDAFDTYYATLSKKGQETVSKALEGSSIDMSTRIVH